MTFTTTHLQGYCYGDHEVSTVGKSPQELYGDRLGRQDHTPQKTHPEGARCADYYIYASIVHVLIWLASFSGHRRNTWQLTWVQTVTSAARKLAVPIKFQNIITWQ